MRCISAHPDRVEPSSGHSAKRPARRFFRTAIFALACLAGVGFSAGDRFEARADDGGMMSFLLNGNSGGRVRATAPVFRFAAPVARERASFVRKVAQSRAKVQARAARFAKVSRHARHRDIAPTLVASRIAPRPLVHKASFEPAAPAEQKVTPASLALKAAAAAARPEDAHFRDRTLRRGDIVATTTGLRVFLGAEHFPYRAKDFVSVSTAKHLTQRADLEALDRSLRGVRTVAAAVQKRVARVAKKIEAGARSSTSRVGKKPILAPQTVALAYAPRSETGVAIATSPGVIAIERVVRRVDPPPVAWRPAINPNLAATGTRIETRRRE